MKHKFLILAATLGALLLGAAAPGSASAANYTRVQITSDSSTYLFNFDIQQGTATTFTYASNAQTVLDLPPAIAAMNGGTVCTYGTQRLRVLFQYSSGGRVVCTDSFGQQSVMAMVADNYNTNHPMSSMTLTDGLVSHTFYVEAYTVSY